MSIVWTKYNLKFLEDNYYTYGAKFCAEHLGCGVRTIYGKAHKLGLKSSKSKTKTNEEYLQELNAKGIKYIPLQPYSGALTKIPHKCPENHVWDICPSKILIGKGCPSCSTNLKKTTDTYIDELVCKNINIAPAEEYIDIKTSINHECLDCGYIWSAQPNKILSGRGCPKCANYGFKSNLPAILYYIKIERFPECFYKIGITNRSIVSRFDRDKDKQITVLLEKHFDKGSDAAKEEKEIIEKYRALRQKVPGFLKSGGNTELFEEDILGLDT
jgi:predicted  nucleic acid-binding Zn-ribbon protein